MITARSCTSRQMGPIQRKPFVDIHFIAEIVWDAHHLLTCVVVSEHLEGHRWIEVFLDSEGGGVVATNSMLFCEVCSRVHATCDLVPCEEVQFVLDFHGYIVT